MKSHITIDIAYLVTKMADDCGVDSETREYVLRRFSNEGIPFLTKTLPGLSKALLEGLERGKLVVPSGFASRNKRNSPRYFRGLLSQVFHLSTGIIREDASSAAISNIRQFCEYWYKVAFAFDKDQLTKAEEKYLDTEREISHQHLDIGWCEVLRKNFETHYPNVARTLVHEVFDQHRPRFGPGSFSGSSKIEWKYWIWKALKSDVVGLTAEVYRAFAGYFKSYPSSDEAVTLSTDDYVCEVEFVPKDSRGPRTISKEPPHLVKGQMAYFDWLSSTLERTTRGRIQFSDQAVNRDLAKDGSITRRWSTLDLKDASDRVSFKLALRVFQNAPAMRWFLLNARSTHARMKVAGDVIRLSKLSGMGSGLTFPTMALLIHLSICSSICLHTGITYRKVKELVYVYGDDVVVPSQWYDFAVAGLARSNLLVNKEKSYNRGFFRESCGGDYFKGGDVTPVRLRLASCDLPSASTYKPQKRSALGLRTVLALDNHFGALQLERHCRELIKKGNYSSAEYIYSRIEEVLGPLPVVSGESPVLGRYEPTSTFSDDTVKRCWVPVPVVDDGPPDLVCPYKYLGSFLKTTHHFSILDGLVKRNPFGEVAVPRMVKLRKQRVHGVERR